MPHTVVLPRGPVCGGLPGVDPSVLLEYTTDVVPTWYSSVIYLFWFSQTRTPYDLYHALGPWQHSAGPPEETESL